MLLIDGFLLLCDNALKGIYPAAHNGKRKKVVIAKIISTIIF